MLADPKVKSIFINIFGGTFVLMINLLKYSHFVNLGYVGIMRCDYIAEGVIKATKELQLEIPLVVRLKGTKEAEAKECVHLFPISSRCRMCTKYIFFFSDRMIRQSGLKIIPFDSLDDAAERAAQLALA